MKTVFFVDSAYLIALAATDDHHHGAAVRLASELDNDETRFVTTRAIFLEIGSALSKVRFRGAACEMFDLMQNDRRVSLVELNSELITNAHSMFRERQDKEWSLTDCISFLVMKERNISEALTTDAHFEQAGFKALLREK